MVPSYLQFSLEALVKEQEKFRTQFASAFGNPAAAFEAYQEQARRNIAIFEQAMAIWTPFGTPLQTPKKPGELQSAPGAKPLGLPQVVISGKTAPKPGQPAALPAPAPRDEIQELKSQLAAMQQKIERISRNND